MIPEDWRVGTLSDLIAENGIISDGDWVESKDQNPSGDVRLIQLADIGDGAFLNKSNRFLTSETAKELKCTFLEKNDILIARMPEPLGRACFFPGDTKKSVTAVDICIVRTGENVDQSWLAAVINSPLFRNEILNRATGTTRKRISRINLVQIEFLTPPLPEQKKIAEILSNVDEAIQATQAVIDQTRKVKQGLLQHLLTRGIGHTRFKQTELGEIPKGWEIVSFSKIVSPEMPPIVMQDEEEYSPVIVRRRHNGIETRETKKGKRILVKSQFKAIFNTFLISRRQIIHGSCGLVPDNLGRNPIISKEYLALKPNSNLDIRYLNYYSQLRLCI